MGFYVMIFSMVIGIVLVKIGFSRRENDKKWKLSTVCGISLVLFSIWLGLPK